MGTLAHILRAGAFAALLSIGAAAWPAFAANSGSASRYALQGRLQAQAPVAASGGYALHGSMVRSKDAPAAQQGGALALSARLGASPLACQSDLIFKDGFDGT